MKMVSYMKSKIRTEWFKVRLGISFAAMFENKLTLLFSNVSFYYSQSQYLNNVLDFDLQKLRKAGETKKRAFPKLGILFSKRISLVSKVITAYVNWSWSFRSKDWWLSYSKPMMQYSKLTKKLYLKQVFKVTC